EGNVKITIFNAVGQEVAVLINEMSPAGVHSIDFNGNNFASGIYYYKLESGSFTQVKKMLLIK
ncbi:MAG: T9SS type A sorting domain-containing protein, partial [Ignavibacteria bacterium]